MSNGFKGEQSNQESPTILQRIARGDRSAADECFSEYGKLIWTFSQRFINNRADAEDLMQEIFIDIWKSAADFDATKSPEWAFIKLIAKRRLFDFLRKLYRSPQTISTEQIINDIETDFHIKLERHVEVQLLIVALNKLSPEDNRIIKMSVFEGMSHEEIAEKISLPLGTIKTRIRRGIQKIRLLSGLKTPIEKM